MAQTNVCVLCLTCRIDLAKPDQPNQIELGRKDESKVHKLFLDPTGEKIFHVYFTFLELSYINRHKIISLIILTDVKSQLNGNSFILW